MKPIIPVILALLIGLAVTFFVLRNKGLIRWGNQAKSDDAKRADK